MRSRGWCLTINNFTSVDQALCMDQDYCGYRYICIGHEVGESGTPHLQVYVYYDNPRYFKSVSKIFNRAHVERQKGPTTDAIEYCKEDGDYYEVGEAPHPGKVDKEKIAAIMAAPFENFHLYNMYRKAYYELQNDELHEHERLLIAIPADVRYQVADVHKPSVVFYPSEYKGEKVFMIPGYYQPEWIKDWIKGYPRRERRGYETYYIDPSIIYLFYADDKEKRIIFHEYIDIIDGCEQVGNRVKNCLSQVSDVSADSKSEKSEVRDSKDTTSDETA